jgi:5,10-methylene-tetrahydrofolate dehydrogenase/methenyl tetrahydrofolate cyclohydrolase
VILASDDATPATYFETKRRGCAGVGIESNVLRFDRGVTREELAARVEEPDPDPSFSGFFARLPLER